MIKHLGTNEIETDRLLIRRFNMNDIEEMFKWSSDPEVAKFPYWSAHENIEITKSILSGWIDSYGKEDCYNWAIEHKEQGHAVGGISVVDYRKDDERCEIAYCINREMRGKGIASESLNEIITFLIKEVGFERIEASYDVNNIASGTVMKKCGMKYEGTKRNFHKNKEGDFVNCDFYAIIKEDIVIK